MHSYLCKSSTLFNGLTSMEKRERIGSEDDIPRSPTYSRVLFEVARINLEGRSVVSSDRELSDALSRDRSTITKQLKLLEGAGYLNSEQQDRYNRIGYTINTRKILDLLLEEYEARLSSDFQDWALDTINAQEDLTKRAELLKQATQDLEHRRQLVAQLKEGPMTQGLSIIFSEYLAEYAHRGRSGFTLDEALKALIHYAQADARFEAYLNALYQNREHLPQEGLMLLHFLDLMVRQIPRRVTGILFVAQRTIQQEMADLGFDVQEIDRLSNEHLQAQKESEEQLKESLSKAKTKATGKKPNKKKAKKARPKE